MTITTYEGIVERGKIRLRPGIRLPEKTRVYIVIPGLQVEKTARVSTPRLAHPEQASDFKLEVSEDKSDASVRC